ncbi:MAG: hypothetical protein DRP09_10250 [Candidatus Thorarchaeota archaeon]|nr:MAG: hypothetical protein DRP09_10250 [Candidatus Thorarchaeota archaeon]
MEESIAISVFERERARKFISPLIPVAGPDEVQSLQRKLRSLLFPEDKYDDLAHVRKAKEMFERLKGVNLNVKPFRDNQAGWKRVQQ